MDSIIHPSRLPSITLIYLFLLFLITPILTFHSPPECFHPPRLAPQEDCEEVLKEMHRIFDGPSGHVNKRWGRTVSATDEDNMVLPRGYQLTKPQEPGVNKHCEIHIDNHVNAFDETATFSMLHVERAGWELMYYCYPYPYLLSGRGYPDDGGGKSVYVTTLWVPSRVGEVSGQEANYTVIYLDSQDSGVGNSSVSTSKIEEIT